MRRAIDARELAEKARDVREVLVDAQQHVDAVGVYEAGRAAVWRQEQREAQRNHREHEQIVVVTVMRAKEWMEWHSFT